MRKWFAGHNITKAKKRVLGVCIDARSFYANWLMFISFYYFYIFCHLTTYLWNGQQLRSEWVYVEYILWYYVMSGVAEPEYFLQAISVYHIYIMGKKCNFPYSIRTISETIILPKGWDVYTYVYKYIMRCWTLWQN